MNIRRPNITTAKTLANKCKYIQEPNQEFQVVLHCVFYRIVFSRQHQKHQKELITCGKLLRGFVSSFPTRSLESFIFFYQVLLYSKVIFVMSAGFAERKRDDFLGSKLVQILDKSKYQEK